jgi:hypothetical protein
MDLPATKLVTLHVTALDITIGTKLTHDYTQNRDRVCPVARAIRRHTDIDAVAVRPTYVEFANADSDYYRISLTPRVVKWIEIFDQSKPVHAFKARLRVPKNLPWHARVRGEKPTPQEAA